MKFPAVDVYQLRLFLIGLLALLISALAATAAGIYLGSVAEILAFLPGLMVLVPPSINMRGSISGVLASRLSSSMHLGEFEINFSKTSVLGLNSRASLSVSIIIAFVLGIFAYLISSAIGLTDLSANDYIIISVFSGVISSLIVMGFALVVILLSYKKGIDLDMVGSPSVTTAADLITIPVLVLTALFILDFSQEIRTLLLLPVLILFGVSIFFALRSGEEIKSVSREMLILLIPLSVICIFAGITYASNLENLVAFSALLILITPFTGGCGSIGGILCSRLATGIHMGEIQPKLIPSKEVIWYFANTYIYVCALMPFLAILAHYCAIFTGMVSPGIFAMLIVSFGAGIIVITFVNLVGYITASLSFRKGFDPDNFGIPVITSFIDFISATVLIVIISLVI
ncbi:MAG: magnesium transporter [Methanomicrobiaceae archaeon]|nr:magnesium transporter [Methanomicrobiaceae archaeon]